MRIEMVYNVAGIKRQDYFRQQKRQINQTFIETRTIEMVKAIRARHPAMGARPMFHALNITGMGINRFERLVSESGLGIERRKLWIKTTNSNHNYFKYSNLTNGLELNWINQLWVSDITYWIDGQTHYYLLFIMDVYSRRVLGYTASRNMYTVNNLKALETSIKIRKASRFEQLIHHSDKGSQYCSLDYVGALQKANITISMAGNSLENPYAERLNGIIKNDYLRYYDTSSFARLCKSLDKVVWLYNNEKPHQELGYMPPVKFEETVMKQNKNERKTMVLYDFTNKPTNGINPASPFDATRGGF
jgi:putative transposase